FRQHEAVVVGILRTARVVAHLREEDSSRDVGGGAARRWMNAAGLCVRAHRIDTQASGDVAQRGYARRCVHERQPPVVIIMTRCGRCGTLTSLHWLFGWAGWSCLAPLLRRRHFKYCRPVSR